MPSATLLPEDKTTIRMAIGHECQIFTATIARLYLAYPDPLKWNLICTGAIAFMKDTRKNDAFFFRFVHLKSGSVVWEQEVFRDFKYYQEKPYFHCFYTDICTAGLSFADENEALSFYSKVQGRDNLRVQPRKVAGANKPAAAASQPSAQNSAAPSTGLFAAKSKGGKKKFDKSAISAPSNFRHLTHVGYDPEKGFSTMNVPPEWKNVFEKAGVTEDQLKDANTAKFIFDFMSQNYNADGAAGAPAPQAAPPPLPAAPPVPVQQTQPATIPKRAAPPPPPSRAPSNAPATPARGPPPVPNRPRPTSIIAPPPEDIPEPPPIPVEKPHSPVGAPVPPPMPPPAPVFNPPPAVERTEKPAPAARKPPAADNRGDLMASIRGGIALKPAAEREVPIKENVAETAPAGDIASALKAALMKRQEVTRGDDSDEEPEEGDDDDW